MVQKFRVSEFQVHCYYQNEHVKVVAVAIMTIITYSITITRNIITHDHTMGVIKMTQDDVARKVFISCLLLNY